MSLNGTLEGRVYLDSSQELKSKKIRKMNNSFSPLKVRRIYGQVGVGVFSFRYKREYNGPKYSNYKRRLRYKVKRHTCINIKFSLIPP